MIQTQVLKPMRIVQELQTCKFLNENSWIVILTRPVQTTTWKCSGIGQVNVKMIVHNIPNRWCLVSATSVGASTHPWTDCKILKKFYEKNVLWAQIECRLVIGKNCVFLFNFFFQCRAINQLLCFTNTFFCLQINFFCFRKRDNDTRPLRKNKVRYTLLRLKTKQLPGGDWEPCIKSRAPAKSFLLRCDRMKLGRYG